MQGIKIWKMPYITFILVMGDLTDHDLQTWDMRPHCVQTRDHPWRSLHQRWAEQTSALQTFFAEPTLHCTWSRIGVSFVDGRKTPQLLCGRIVHNYDQDHLVSISMLRINTCPFNAISKIRALNHDRPNFFSNLSVLQHWLLSIHLHHRLWNHSSVSIQLSSAKHFV